MWKLELPAAVSRTLTERSSRSRSTRLLQRWTVYVQMSKIDQSIDWVRGASMMIRRSIIDKIGGFDEGYFATATH
jgi:GT2 family glycosyltransferase